MGKERQLMSEKKVCPCYCEKHTARSEEEKKKLINRLNVLKARSEAL